VGRSNARPYPYRHCFAALRESASGTKRPSRDGLLIVRFWSRADMDWGVASTSSIADDP